MIEIETALAQAQMDNVKRRDPKNINNKMTLAQVRELTPSIDWDEYLKAVKAPASDHFIVTSPDFFRAEEKLLNQHPLDHWQAYMRWQVIHRAAPFLNKAVVDENFDFFAHTLAGAEKQRPRWRRCVTAADRDLGDALGQAYVDRAFPPDSKARTIQMVHAIEAALKTDIQEPLLDVPRDQGTSHRQAEGDRRQDRLSRALARLLHRHDRARQLSQQRRAGHIIRVRTLGRKDRQARRSRRVDDDSAHHQRLLRSAVEHH